MSDLVHPISIQIKPEDKTVAATPTIFAFVAPEAGTVVGCYAFDTTNVAKNATNYMILTLTNTGAAGAGTVSMGTLSGNGASGNMVTAGIPAAFTLSTTAANLQFAKGDIIKLVKTEAAGGLDFTEGSFQLDVIYAQ